MSRRVRPGALDGRVVAVTGAARGIGAALARRAHAAGARVAIGDLDLDEAKRTAEAIGDGVLALPLDVTDRASLVAFMDDTERLLGDLDVLVNNAGIMVTERFLDEPAQLIDRQIAVNLAAVVHGSQEAARRMVPRGSGHIVNVASAAGRIAFTGVATYSATKFGVVGLSEALRRELAGTGVGITCVMPGLVDTELVAGVPRQRMLPPVAPDDLADLVLAAVVARRFAVYTPRTIPVMVRMSALLPTGVGDRLVRLAGGDHAMLDAAHAPGRAAYEERVSSRLDPNA